MIWRIAEAVNQHLATIERAEIARLRITPNNLLLAGSVTESVLENCSAA
jgi:hypothetical protein